MPPRPAPSTNPHESAGESSAATTRMTYSRGYAELGLATPRRIEGLDLYLSKGLI